MYHSSYKLTVVGLGRKVFAYIKLLLIYLNFSIHSFNHTLIQYYLRQTTSHFFLLVLVFSLLSLVYSAL